MSLRCPILFQKLFLYISSCWSFVGMIGGEQNLSLGNGCMHVSLYWRLQTHRSHRLYFCKSVQYDGDLVTNIQPRQTSITPGRTTQIARLNGPTWGPSGVDRTQVSPMIFAIWVVIILSGRIIIPPGRKTSPPGRKSNLPRPNML